MNALVIFFPFRSNFANRSNGTVEKWVFIAKIYGQLTKQHRFGKKQQQTSFLPQFDGFRIRRVVLERVLCNLQLEEDFTDADFENSLYAFGQSEKR